MFAEIDKVFYDAKGNAKMGFFIDDNLYYNLTDVVIPSVKNRWDFIVAVSGIEGCLSSSQTIKTSKGILPVGQIGEQDIIVKAVDFKRIKPHNYRPWVVETPARVIHSGKKQVYKITTESGKEVIATADHKLFVRRDGKIIELELKDILTTDEMVCATQYFKWTPDLDDKLRREYHELLPDGFIKKYDLPISKQAVNHRRMELKIPPLTLDALSKIKSDNIKKSMTKRGIWGRGKVLPRLTTEQLAECKKLFLEEKIPCSELAKKYNTASYVVIHALRDEGIDTARYNPNQKIWSEQEKIDFSEDIKTLTTVELEKKYGQKWLTALKKKAKKMGIFKDRDSLAFRKLANQTPEIIEHQRQVHRAMLVNGKRTDFFKFIYRRCTFTDIELMMKSILDDIGVPYKYFISIKMGDRRVFPDFLIGKLIIECDGERWHNDRDDTARDNIITANGYQVLHFKGMEIKQTPGRVGECILTKLNELRNLA